jgi:dienelactone hydrolase
MFRQAVLPRKRYQRLAIFGFGLLTLAGGAMALLSDRILNTTLPSGVVPVLPGPFLPGLRREMVATSRGMLAVDLWYPRTAEPAVDAKASSSQALPDRLVKLGVVEAARPADGAEAWPLLVFAPGWNGGRQSNTVLLAAIASAGYVVAAIEDVGAAGTHLPADMLNWDFSSEAGFMRSWGVGNQRLVLMTTRMRDVIDALLSRTAGDAAWVLAGRLDPNRVGAFGFSFGGSVAAAAPRVDPRIKAAANLDGWLFGERSAAAPGVPYLSFNSDFPQIDRDAMSSRPGPRLMATETIADRQLQRRLLHAPNTYALIVKGTQHQDFSDGLFAPPLRAYLRAPWGLWSAGQLRVHGILTDLLLDFFNAHVRQSGVATRVQARPGPYREAQWLTME